MGCTVVEWKYSSSRSTSFDGFERVALQGKESKSLLLVASKNGAVTL